MEVKGAAIMVDAIGSNVPVANVSIPPTLSIGNSVSVGKSTLPSPSPLITDQVNLSPEAQIAARQIFSERPDINTSQAQAMQISDASDAVVEQAESFVSSQPAPSLNTTTVSTGISSGTQKPAGQPETVTVPPPDTSSIGGNSAPENETGETEIETGISELVELR